MGLNAIVLHVRTAADALYPSKLVPWSAFLSGTSGRGPSPAYDPLAFAITESPCPRHAAPCLVQPVPRHAAELRRQGRGDACHSREPVMDPEVRHADVDRSG